MALSVHHHDVLNKQSMLVVEGVTRIPSVGSCSYVCHTFKDWPRLPPREGSLRPPELALPLWPEEECFALELSLVFGGRGAEECSLLEWLPCFLFWLFMVAVAD